MNLPFVKDAILALKKDPSLKEKRLNLTNINICPDCIIIPHLAKEDYNIILSTSKDSCYRCKAYTYYVETFIVRNSATVKK